MSEMKPKCFIIKKKCIEEVLKELRCVPFFFFSTISKPAVSNKRAFILIYVNVTALTNWDIQGCIDEILKEKKKT